MQVAESEEVPSSYPICISAADCISVNNGGSSTRGYIIFPTRYEILVTEPSQHVQRLCQSRAFRFGFALSAREEAYSYMVFLSKSTVRSKNTYPQMRAQHLTHLTERFLEPETTFLYLVINRCSVISQDWAYEVLRVVVRSTRIRGHVSVAKTGLSK